MYMFPSFIHKLDNKITFCEIGFLLKKKSLNYCIFCLSIRSFEKHIIYIDKFYRIYLPLRPYY